MNIKQYIESGILEKYILGLTTEQERAEVTQYINQYPEIKAEIDNIENTLANYVLLHQVQPPAHLRAQILDKIATLEQSASSSSNNNNTLWSVLGISLVLATLAALYFYNQYSSSQQELNTNKAAYEEAQVLCDSIKNQNEDLLLQNRGLESQIAFLVDEAKQVTTMKGTEKAPDAVAKIHWNAATKKAFIDVGNMPTPTAGKQYQLWAIVDGKPVDMKPIALDAQAGELIEVDFIENAQAFAVTLEDEGGNPTPTLEEMYVVGNV